MVEAWTNFVKFGDPNNKNQKTWLPYTKENPGFMIFSLEGGEAVAKMGQPLPASANR
jgi:carboxylesterase type B